MGRQQDMDTDDTPISDDRARTDVAVCGSGLAGLAAAATAAAAGANVMVLDARPPGGRARTASVHGVLMNAGPHALYRGGAAERVLATLGVGVDGVAPPLSGARLWVRGRVELAPVGPMSLLRTRALRGRRRLALGRVMDAARRADPASVADLSIRQWCERARLDAETTAVVDAFARLATYADRPTSQSAEALLGQLQLPGVLYLHGGWQTLVDGLCERAATAGVSFVRRGVSDVAPDGSGGWTVTTTDGRRIEAGAVVLAAGGPSALEGLTDLPTGWADTTGPPVTASCLDLVLDRDPPLPFLLGVDEPLYLSRHDPPARLISRDITTETGRPGRALVSVARYHQPDDHPDPDHQRAELLGHAERAGITSDQIVHQRYLHAMTVAHGVPRAETGGFAGRPTVAVPDRPGLFAAGDWIGHEGLLTDAALASGETAGLDAARRASHLHRTDPSAAGPARPADAA